MPRQITTFEFKLIGFMTLKQFIYLVVFIPTAYIVFSLFPVPVLNFLLAATLAFIGIALAFIPINDRPLEVFILNLFKRLTSPTQYYYNKSQQPVYFLTGNLKTGAAEAHAEAKKKLADYLSFKKHKKEEEEEEPEPKQQAASVTNGQNYTALEQNVLESLKKEEVEEKKDETATKQESESKPYLVGEVKNSKSSPLPGVLVYIRDQEGKPLRLLKTNHYGVFATYKPLPKGEYTFEVKDPKGQFFFDTMKMNLESQNLKPVEFYSKELL